MTRNSVASSTTPVEVLRGYPNKEQRWSDLRKLLDMRPDGPPVRFRIVRQHQHRLDSDELVALQDDYRAGARITDIAARFGIHKNTVRELAKRLGLPSRYPILDTEKVSRAVELYKSGLVAKSG
jgi:hypothetical protein